MWRSLQSETSILVPDKVAPNKTIRCGSKDANTTQNIGEWGRKREKNCGQRPVRPQQRPAHDRREHPYVLRDVVGVRTEIKSNTQHQSYRRCEILREQKPEKRRESR